MVIGRNGYVPKWSSAEMVMGQNDPESGELFICPIDSNGDSLVFDSLFQREPARIGVLWSKMAKKPT